MIRIRTGSRLHFGLFSLPSEQSGPWLNQEGQPTIPRRQFGGVGLMIDQPGFNLTVERADTWSADGPLAARALEIAQSFCTSLQINDAFRLNIESAVPAHVGLGSGTQMALAVMRALAELTGGGRWGDLARSHFWLAKNFGRAERSAIGVLGFGLGGFIVEGGKSSAEISPLLFGYHFPDEEWKILLVTPSNLQGAHGWRETSAFADLAARNRDDATTNALCRIVLLGMMPALCEEDLATFGEALYDFNRRVGEMFQPTQGGIYSHPRVDEIVKILRQAGVKGVAQSSWGPTVCAIVSSQQVTEVRDWLIRNRVAPEEILLTCARNHEAVLSTQH